MDNKQTSRLRMLPILLGATTIALAIADMVALDRILFALAILIVREDPDRMVQTRYQIVTLHRYGYVLAGLSLLVFLFTVLHRYSETKSGQTLWKRFLRVSACQLLVIGLGYLLAYPG